MYQILLHLESNVQLWIRPEMSVRGLLLGGRNAKVFQFQNDARVKSRSRNFLLPPRLGSCSTVAAHCSHKAGRGLLGVGLTETTRSRFTLRSHPMLPVGSFSSRRSARCQDLGNPILLLLSLINFSH
jgi:hypothetical protein